MRGVMSDPLTTAAFYRVASPRGAHAVVCHTNEPCDPCASTRVVCRDGSLASDGAGNGVLDKVLDVLVTRITGFPSAARLKDAHQVGAHSGVINQVGAARHAPMLHEEH